MRIELQQDIYMRGTASMEKEKFRLVLELEGARQVGKTYILDNLMRAVSAVYLYQYDWGVRRIFSECYEKAYHRSNIQGKSENGNLLQC